MHSHAKKGNEESLTVFSLGMQLMCFRNNQNLEDNPPYMIPKILLTSTEADDLDK